MFFLSIYELFLLKLQDQTQNFLKEDFKFVYDCKNPETDETTSQTKHNLKKRIFFSKERDC